MINRERSIKIVEDILKIIEDGFYRNNKNEFILY